MNQELSIEQLASIVGGGSGGGREITCGAACAICATCGVQGKKGNQRPGKKAKK